MKLLKIALIVVIATLLSIVGIGAYLLTNTTLQTKIANDFLKENLDGSTLESVNIGTSGLVVNNVKIETPQCTFTAKAIKAKYGLLRLLSKSIEVESLELENAKIVLKQATSSPSQILSQPEKTFTNATLTKKSNPPLAKNEPQANPLGDWKFTVVSLLADLEIEAQNDSKIIANISARNLKIEENFKPSDCKINIDISAIKKNEKPEIFSVVAEVAKGKDNKKHALLSATHGKAQLLSVDFILSENFSSGSGKLRVDITDKNLSELLADIVILPNFSSVIYAETDFANFGKEIKTDAKIEIYADNLEKVNPTLKHIGKCGLFCELSAQIDSNKITLSKLSLSAEQNKTTIVSAEWKKQASATFDGKGIIEAETTFAIPHKTIASFIKGAEFSAKSALCGKADLKFDGKKISFATTSPFSISGVNLNANGSSILRNLGVEAKFDAIYALDGKYSADAILTAGNSRTESATLTTKINGKGNSLEASTNITGKITPFLEQIPSISNFKNYEMTIDAHSDLALSGDLAILKKLSLKILDKKSADVLKMISLDEIAYNIADKKIVSKSKDLLSISAKEFPFAPIKPFAKNTDAEAISIDATLSHKNFEIFEVSAELGVKSLSVKNETTELLNAISTNTNCSLSYNVAQKTADVEISKLKISASQTDFAYGELTAKIDLKKQMPLIKSDIKFSTALPVLLRQPALLKFANIASGKLEFESTTENNIAKISARIDNLKTLTKNEVLGSVKLDGNMTFSDAYAPLTARISANTESTNGKTDTILNVNFAPDKIKISADAKSIVLEDILVLSSAFTNPNYQAALAVKESNSTGKRKIIRPIEAQEAAKRALEQTQKLNLPRDKKAFWNLGKALEVNAKLGKLLKDSKEILSNAKIEFACDETNLSLKNLDAVLYNAQLTASAKIKFDESQKKPYQLSDSAIKLENIDIVNLFADPQKAMITGIFSAQVNLQSNAGTLEALANSATGKASIKSTGGTLKLIEKSSIKGATINLAGTALKLTGALLQKGIGAGKNISGTGDLLTLLSDLPYSNVDITASRKEPDFDIVFDSAKIQASEILFDASNGKIIWSPDSPLAESELDVPVKMLVKDSNIRTLFSTLGFAKKESETQKGWYDAPSFKIYGSLEKPENNLIKAILTPDSQETTSEKSKDETTKALRNLGSSLIKSFLK